MALQPYQTYKPMAPLNLILLTKSEKGSKDFYTTLQEPIDLIAHTKWNHILNRDILNQTWERIHKACFNTVKDNYLIHLQFRIINQILGTRDLLHKMSITDNSKCNFCKDHNKTIAHLFFDCKLVLLLWHTLYNWIYNKLKIRIPLEFNPNSHAINTINMITKSYIFFYSRGKQKPNIFICKIELNLHSIHLNLCREKTINSTTLIESGIKLMDFLIKISLYTLK